MVQLASVPTAGGGFFKNADELESGNFYLVEPIRLEKDRPSNNGYPARDALHAHITSFTDEKDIAKGGTRRDSVIVQGGGLTRGMEDLVGQAFVATLAKGKAKPGQSAPYIWEEVAPALEAKVGKFLEEREAKLKADMDDAPDFD